MGHSIRSKKKRAFRAIKRERYALKERACLEKLVEGGTLRKYVEEFKNSREEPIEGVEHGSQTQGSITQSEVQGSLQEMKDVSEPKRNWESRNQIRRKKKKAASLKMKNKKNGQAYKFSSGTMSKSSW